MPVFAYTALDRTGRQTSGTMPADNRSAALEQLIVRGLSPVSIEETQAGAAPARQFTGVEARDAVGRRELHARAGEPAAAGSAAVQVRCNLLSREAAQPATRKRLAGDPRRCGGRPVAGRCAGEMAQGVLDGLRGHGAGRRGGRVPGAGASADRRLSRPRAGPARQGQGGDGLSGGAGGAGVRRAHLPADLLHPAFLGHLRAVRQQAAGADPRDRGR